MSVQDPCYSAGSKPLTVQLQVPAGRWRAWITRAQLEGFGDRVSSLVAAHEGTTAAAEPTGWQPVGAIPVDSGQAGIFARDHVDDDAAVPSDWKWGAPMVDAQKRWYSMVSDQSLTPKGGGVVPFGVVSSSGTGDGIYAVETISEEDSIVGIRVDYLRPR